jgi:hypothetical protein
MQPPSMFGNSGAFGGSASMFGGSSSAFGSSFGGLGGIGAPERQASSPPDSWLGAPVDPAQRPTQQPLQAGAQPEDDGGSSLLPSFFGFDDK